MTSGGSNRRQLLQDLQRRKTEFAAAQDRARQTIPTLKGLSSRSLSRLEQVANDAAAAFRQLATAAWELARARAAVR